MGIDLKKFYKRIITISNVNNFINRGTTLFWRNDASNS
jgi:hypothetical protein